MHPIEIKLLTKHYKLPNKGTKVALDCLSISVPESTIFGFLGPNGAGKTTTIKLLLNFLEPTSGEISLFGLPAENALSRSKIGYLPEQPYFPRFLKPIEVVKLHAQLSGLRGKQAETNSWEALEISGIAEYAQTPISKLSKGLTQRVGIAQALVNAPKLLILDEPTSGLDPIGRRHTRELLSYLKSEGVTIFLSSHVLSEIEEICDNIAIVNKGKLIACGTPAQIRQNDPTIEIRTAPLPSEAVSRLQYTPVIIQNTDRYSTLQMSPDVLLRCLHILEDLQIKQEVISTKYETLEEAFLRLVA